MGDIRNNLAKARDAFLQSERGTELAKGIVGRLDDYYMRNRIEAAFIAGWNAAEAASKAAPARDAAGGG
jgi:hypothetical protein